MKTTTESQLAEQQFKDYLKDTQHTDAKFSIAFMFNEYSRHFGIPLKLVATSPKKYATICAISVVPFSRFLNSSIEKEWQL